MSVRQFVPEWARDAIFYQIFPERFANGDPASDPPNVQPWGSRPTPESFFGGDLKGIIDHLDYIADLGVNAIYLTPIFSSPSNHKYSTSDYLKVDPAFGTLETFRQLLEECHRRGIRLILDGVFNHTGTSHWAFQDIMTNGESSPYLGWYNVYSFPLVLRTAHPEYECWWGSGKLPKLMVQNPEVKKHLLEVTEFWTKAGIDGWRLDVPNDIAHEFWKEWRRFVKEINPECYIVGEIWGDGTEWLQGDEFDAVMNYEFRKACLDFFCGRVIAPSEFDLRLSQTRSAYPEQVNYALQNLLGSHDTERLLTICNREEWKVRIAVLFQMTYLGAPMVYYGDEIGMEGGKDPDCRRTMIWDKKEWNAGLHDYYRTLIAARRQSGALRRGDFRTLVADNKRGVLAFNRRLGDEVVYVIINQGKTPQEVPLGNTGESAPYSDILSGRRTTSDHGRMVFNVGGRSGALLFPIS
ncbi:MAG TPA: glycoside hydrolase family 13 protein [Bacteroidota bacterium]|nr:glycoside hydrolase family 13 protein [Bacteroidota bacterium]